MKQLDLNGLDRVDSISPAGGAKYSPNLYKFMSAVRQRHTGIYTTGYRDKDGVIWLGYVHGTDFVGARLISVLCDPKAETGCYMSLKLTKIENFWPDYIAAGRCAIDPKHEIEFIDERWTVQGDQRTCGWCGHVQHLHHWNETVIRSAWRDESAGGGAVSSVTGAAQAEAPDAVRAGSPA